jgi:hypothetical protein
MLLPSQQEINVSKPHMKRAFINGRWVWAVYAAREDHWMHDFSPFREVAFLLAKGLVGRYS